MSRNNFSKIAKKRHKKIINQTKGYRGRSNNCFRIALQKRNKGLSFAYQDRKKNKNLLQKFFIQKINLSLMNYGVKYSDFINIVKSLNIRLSKKQIVKLFLENIDIMEFFINKIKKEYYSKSNFMV